MHHPEPAYTMCAGQYLVWGSLARGPECYPGKLLFQHPGQEHHPCSQVRSHPLYRSLTCRRLPANLAGTLNAAMLNHGDHSMIVWLIASSRWTTV